MGNLPWYGQLGAFVAGAAVMAGAFYYFVEIDKQVTLAAKAKELGEIQARVTKGVESARRLPEFRKQVSGLESRLEGLKPILPEEKDVGDLLRRIQTLAVQSNLVILGFRPQVTTAKPLHDEWPIALVLEGNYHDLGLFLDRVSKFPRIINIGNIAIDQINPPVGGTTMEIQATATTFVLVDRPAEPPAKAPVR
jgi:type IV pilus assembly protein PilO